MSTSFNHILVQAYHGRSITELLDAPIDALRGVSAADAEALETALGISSIRELAENRFAMRARAILSAANQPRHDPGPNPEWDDFFTDAPIEYYTQHASGRFRPEFGPVYYRGRLDGSARVLVVGQDPATNEIIAHRAFVGRSGQLVQGLLARMGITRSYVCVNTFLFSVYGQFDQALRAASEEEAILAYRNAFLDRLAGTNRIEAIWAMGNAAHHAVSNWPGRASIPVFDFVHPAALDFGALFANWNAGIGVMRNVVAPDEDGMATYGQYGPVWQEADLIKFPYLIFRLEYRLGTVTAHVPPEIKTM